jgi:hypothetical protein
VDLGEWDRAGVVVKTKLRNEQLWNPARTLQNDGNVVEFLEETLSDRIVMSHPRFGRNRIYRFFHHVAGVARQESDILNSYCEPIPGSRSYHSISSVSAVDLLNWWPGTCCIFVHLILPRIGMDALTKDASNPGYFKNCYRRILG